MYKSKKDDGWTYSPLQKEIDKRTSLIDQAKLVMDKFPDAEFSDFDGAPDSLLYMTYTSESIKYEKDLKIDFGRIRRWWSIDVTFYYEIPFDPHPIKVYGKPHCLKIWQVPFGIYSLDDPYVTWNHIDQGIVQFGYDEKHIKLIYNEIILCMSKKTEIYNGKPFNVRITNKEEITSYITNKMAFL